MDSLSRLRSGELKGATRLKLREGLTEFPREIFDLAESLELLDLSGNRLSSLPEDLPRLHRLKILFCSENDFEELPAALGECEELEMIGFKSNRIEMISPEAFPPRLRWLILTDNRIADLPTSIANCPRLQKLMLAGNRLERLPDGMAACVNLELIRLGANRFREFPEWLSELPQLAWLGLGGNPWCEEGVESRIPVEEVDWSELEILGKLGEGASGSVYQATRNYPGETGSGDVAVKVFKGSMTSDGFPASEMDVSLALGSHPNLTKTIGTITNHPDAKSGLLMPLLDPGYASLAGPPDFETCTRDVYPVDRRFTVDEVLKTALEIASAAGHLHERGIMHGDLYGHNILRHSSGHCILSDFGAGFRYPAGARVEAIEVRAFGVLFGELLERMETVEKRLMEELVGLQECCVASEVTTRVSFREIVGKLAGCATERPRG